MVSPRKSRKKSACFSRTTISTPARARRKPSTIPAGPPPTMQQPVWMLWEVLSTIYSLIERNPERHMSPYFPGGRRASHSRTAEAAVTTQAEPCYIFLSLHAAKPYPRQPADQARRGRRVSSVLVRSVEFKSLLFREQRAWKRQIYLVLWIGIPMALGVWIRFHRQDFWPAIYPSRPRFCWA